MNDDVNENNDDDYRVNNEKATASKYFECKTILTHETNKLLFKYL